MDYAEIAQVLIKAGANVDEPDWDELTPLHVAARSGYGEIALILVKHNASLTAVDNEGKTPLALAEFVNEEAMAAFLKECEMGRIPDKAPSAQVREVREQREIVVPEGWGPG